MLAHYQKLLAIRSEYKELFAGGDRTSIALSNDEGYDVFKRTLGGESLIVALNITSVVNEVTFPVEVEAGTVLTDLYSGNTYTVSETQEVTVSIPAAAEGGTVILAIADAGEGNIPSEDVNGNDTNGNNNGLIIAVAAIAVLGIGAGVFIGKKKKKA